MSDQSYPTSHRKPNLIFDNDDILIEILVLLPLKSLLRFKSVSKHWNSVISSPQISRHLYPDVYLISGLLLRRSSCLRSPEYDLVPLTHNPTSPPFRTLNFLNHSLGLQILQSCHGLLLCSSRCSVPYLVRNDDYYIYNPTTKQFRSIPHPGGQKLTRIHGINLAYNPEDPSHYQVICVREADLSKDYLGIYYGYQEDYLIMGEDAFLGDYRRCRIEIYSSKKRTWRGTGKAFIAHGYLNFNNGVYWNGAVHWVSPGFPSLYFKLNDEKLRKMPVPDDIFVQGCRFAYLNESRQHLHLAVIPSYTTKFDVYELKVDYSEWFVKYHVDLETATSAYPEMVDMSLDLRYKTAILAVVREAEEEESYMVLHIPGKAIRYRFRDGSFYKICDFSMGCKEIGDYCFPEFLKFRSSDSYQLIETFASI